MVRRVQEALFHFALAIIIAVVSLNLVLGTPRLSPTKSAFSRAQSESSARQNPPNAGPGIRSVGGKPSSHHSQSQGVGQPSRTIDGSNAIQSNFEVRPEPADDLPSVDLVAARHGETLEKTSLSIPHHTRHVRIKLRLDSISPLSEDSNLTYDVELRNPAGRRIWSVTQRKPQVVGAEQSVVVLAPGYLFKVPGQYSVYLNPSKAMIENPAAALARASFPFSVNLKKPAPPNGTGMVVDDGTFERVVGYPDGGKTPYFVNRLTPNTYPAKLSAVQIYFGNRANGLKVNDRITLLVGTTTHGADLTGQTFTSYSTYVGYVGEFNQYKIPAVRIKSGDFVLGFSVVNPAGIFPADQDVDSGSKQRSYISTDGQNFVLVDSFGPSLAGNFGIRGVGTTGGVGTPTPTMTAVDASRITCSHGRLDLARPITPTTPNGLTDVIGFGDPRIGAPGLLTTIAAQPDPFHITLTGDPAMNPVVVAGSTIPSGFSLVVAEGLSDPGAGGVVFARWNVSHPLARFGGGNFYASVAIPGTSIFAGSELVTSADFAAYTANSIIWEAPSPGDIIQGHDLMGGSVLIYVEPIEFPPGTQPVMGAPQSVGIEWARTLHIEIEVISVCKASNGTFSITARANSFGNSLEPITDSTIRWAYAGNDVTVIGDIVNNDGVLFFNIPASEEGVQAQLYAARSSLGFGAGSTNPFATPVPAPPQSIGLSTFHSGGCTLVDTTSFLVKVSGSCQATTGTVTGTVRNAQDGSPLEGATVTIEGTDLSTTSASDGTYTLENVPSGEETLTASAPGFQSTQLQIDVPDGDTLTENITLSPNLNQGELRITLNWTQQGSGTDAVPADLDAHLIGPNPDGSCFHVYYGNPGSLDSAPFAQLEVDNIRVGYVPTETIHISKLSPGTYTFYVNNYRGDTDPPGTLSSCQATVQVYDSSGLVQTFNVPGGGVLGNNWVVFTLDGATGRITAVNVLEDPPSSCQ